MPSLMNHSSNGAPISANAARRGSTQAVFSWMTWIFVFDISLLRNGPHGVSRQL
jgi:hypothetical protein